jgi:hypothetical protein
MARVERARKEEKLIDIIRLVRKIFKRWLVGGGTRVVGRRG